MQRLSRRWRRGGARAVVPPALLLVIAGLAACPTMALPSAWEGPPSRLPSPSPNNGFAPHAQPCNTTAPNAPAPTAEHGLFVLAPPLKPQGNFYHDMTRYLLNNTLVCGADFWIHWSDVDHGPSASPQYNWTSVNQAIGPWERAGKVVNLIFWAVGYGKGATYVPAYVLSNVPTIQCGNSPVTPLFWNASYVHYYRAFMRAVIQHFNNDSQVGYLRFGFGTGGETLPLIDGDTPLCKAKLLLLGYSIPVWDSYILSMLDYAHSLPSVHPFLVALDGAFGPKTDDTYADIAARAAKDGIGFGSEALERSSLTWNNTTGQASCLGMGFCWLFNKFQGRVPLEVQTLGPSTPNGSGAIGSLVPILSYSLQVHAQIFEVYFSDWLVAFDPHYPGYATYHVAYAHALKLVARVVG